MHGYNGGRNAVGIYALLQNKTEETYKRVMNYVNFLTGGVVRNSINVDFERGAINDVETVPKYKQIRLLFSLVEKHIKKI